MNNSLIKLTNKQTICYARYMSPDRPRFIDILERLTLPHPRVQALQKVWEAREKRLNEWWDRPIKLPGHNTSGFTREDWIDICETAARAWANFELDMHQGNRTQSEVTKGMATILQGFNHETHFLNMVARRADELLDELQEDKTSVIAT